MKKLFAILFLFLTITPIAQAQIGKVTAIKGKVDNGYNFWLYAPQAYADQPQRDFPLVLYLHGQALCGRSLRAVDRYYTLDAIKMGREINAMVIAPQNPGGGWKPERLKNVIDWVADNYRVDTDSIYAVGMSLGGYGIMDLVGTYPTTFAAAIAVAGGTTLTDVQPMGELPLWIIHGTADRAVPISKSKAVVEALKREDNDDLLRYTWLPGVNHGRPARIFYLKQMYDWLFSHSRASEPQVVNRDISITLDDIAGTYRGLNSRNKTPIPQVNDIE